VASFLGVSNLIHGTVSGSDTVRLDRGPEVRVPAGTLDGRTGEVAVGIRPEKIELGNGQPNALEGKVVEQAYVGVATQYIVENRVRAPDRVPPERVTRAERRVPGDRTTLSWSPDSTFVVDSMEGSE
jgi:ABC-type Fe3+/spermidine/putrescine transport system ATPase subunit